MSRSIPFRTTVRRRGSLSFSIVIVISNIVHLKKSVIVIRAAQTTTSCPSPLHNRYEHLSYFITALCSFVMIRSREVVSSSPLAFSNETLHMTFHRGSPINRVAAFKGNGLRGLGTCWRQMKHFATATLVMHNCIMRRRLHQLKPTR